MQDNQGSGHCLAGATGSWSAGLARTDITAFEPGVTTVAGWGRPELRLRGVAQAIHARALVLRAGDQHFVMACVELCFVSGELREAILAALERARPGLFGSSGLVLSATHSHGGPDGVNPKLAYSASNRGFSPWVFDAVVAGVVEAILLADARSEPACLRFASVEIPVHEPVAFNRSLAAFARNHDAPAIPANCPELATHRTSACLRIEDAHGRALGLVNWFGVHGTSVHADAERVHGDNKGIAATLVEQRMGEDPDARPEFVAIFVQEAAGDVSPNHRWDPRRKLAVAAFADDFECARHNGEIQARYALEALAVAARSGPLAPELEARLRRVDMTRLEVDPDFVAAALGRVSLAGRSTGAPVLGLSLVVGADDGPGPLRPLSPALRGLVAARRAWSRLAGASEDVKLPFVDTSGGVGSGRFLGKLPLRASLRLFAPFEARAAFARAIDDAGLADEPLLPEVLPLQIASLGALTIVALPFEPSTMAGHRIRATIRAHLRSAGPVVLTTYANDYANYLTTFEEYGEQAYEGGATVFGPWSLDACRTALVALVEDRELASFETGDLPTFDRARAERQHELGAVLEPSRRVARRPGEARVPPILAEVDGYHHPASEAEVQALIRFARASGRAVRVVGARHSVGAAIHPSPGLERAIELRLDRLSSVRFDDSSMQVRVGGGCHLGLDPRDQLGRSTVATSLCAQLEARGWALASLGGISHQTIAGFLATGSAGGSLRWSLSEQVVGLRLVDGTGAVHDLERERERDAFDAALVSLGLLGVVTEVRLQCEPSFDVRGSERVVERAAAVDDPEAFDLEADGAAGLMAWFARHDYARVLWWPQPGVDRLAIWVGERVSPGSSDEARIARPYEAFPRLLGSRIPMQAAAGRALETIARLGGVRGEPAAPGRTRDLGERAASALYRAFVPVDAGQEFSGPWSEVIPLDDQIDERWMPVCFTEIWIAAPRAGEALRRLAALFERDGYAATQNFTCELYPAKASRAWLSPGHGRDSLRINLFWLERDERDPSELWFPRIHAALADLDPRMHWGKHLARDAELTRELARGYARRAEFLALRERLDPDGLFLTDYWRTKLDVEPQARASAPAARSAPRRPRSRRLFHVDDPANTAASGRAVLVEGTRVIPGSRGQVWSLVLDRASWPAWMPGLRSVNPTSEHATQLEFDNLRVAIEHARGEGRGTDASLVARLSAASVPALRGARVELEVQEIGPHSSRVCVRLEVCPVALLDFDKLGVLLRWRLRRWLGGALDGLCVELDRRAWLATRPSLDAALWPLPPLRPLVVVPPVFHMQPAGAELLHRGRAHLRATATIPAPARIVDRAITRFEGAERWLASFIGVRWLSDTREGPGTLFDELFSFMTLRVRTLEHEPGRRWLAVCEACSLPLATRMVEQMRFEPLTADTTLLDWHLAFDAPTILRPGVAVVGPLFQAWMQRSLDQLAAYHSGEDRASEDRASEDRASEDRR